MSPSPPDPEPTVRFQEAQGNCLQLAATCERPYCDVSEKNVRGGNKAELWLSWESQKVGMGMRSLGRVRTVRVRKVGHPQVGLTSTWQSVRGWGEVWDVNIKTSCVLLPLAQADPKFCGNMTWHDRMRFRLSDVSVSPGYPGHINSLGGHSSLPGVFVLTVSAVLGCRDQVVHQSSIPLTVVMPDICSSAVCDRDWITVGWSVETPGNRVPCAYRGKETSLFHFIVKTHTCFRFISHSPAACFLDVPWQTPTHLFPGTIWLLHVILAPSHSGWHTGLLS